MLKLQESKMNKKVKKILHSKNKKKIPRNKMLKKMLKTVMNLFKN